MGHGSRSAPKACGAAIAVGVVRLHVVSSHRRVEPTISGLGWDLASHVLWMVAAAAAIIARTRVAPRDGDDAGE